MKEQNVHRDKRHSTFKTTPSGTSPDKAPTCGNSIADDFFDGNSLCRKIIRGLRGVPLRPRLFEFALRFVFGPATQSPALFVWRNEKLNDQTRSPNTTFSIGTSSVCPSQSGEYRDTNKFIITNLFFCTIIFYSLPFSFSVVSIVASKSLGQGQPMPIFFAYSPASPTAPQIESILRL